MVDTIVFHLGDRKTGSTSIQHTLAQRGWQCDPVSLYYPNQINQIPLAKSLTDPNQAKHRENRFSTLERRMAGATADVGIVSAEDFEDASPQLLKETLETYLPAYANDIRMIAYVRPHADRIVSSWAQQVKMGLFTDTLEAFHDHIRSKGRFYYHDRFCKWRDVFGDQFTLRPMLRGRLYNRSVVQDLFHFALQTDDFTIKEAKSNESTTLEDMALLKAFHQEFRKTHKYSKLQANIGGTMARIFGSLPARSTATKPRLSKAMVPEVIATYQEDAQKMDADFFDGTPLSDALANAADKATETAPSIRSIDHFSGDELRSIQALAQMISTLTDADEVGQRLHLRDKLEADVAGTSTKGPKTMRRRKKQQQQQQDVLDEVAIKNDLLDLI